MQKCVWLCCLACDAAVKADVRMRKRASVCRREDADAAVLSRWIKNTLGGQRALARKALSSKPLVNKGNSEEQWEAKAIVDVELATAAGGGWIGESRGREQLHVSSFCVAIFTAYLLLSCCRVAVNAFRAAAAALHGGVQDAETSLRVYRVRVRAQDI